LFNDVWRKQQATKFSLIASVMHKCSGYACDILWTEYTGHLFCTSPENRKPAITCESHNSACVRGYSNKQPVLQAIIEYLLGQIILFVHAAMASWELTATVIDRVL